MECHITTKSLKINLKRNIGTVLIIVEGASDEFVMKGNENSRVIVYLKRYRQFFCKNIDIVWKCDII